MPPKSKTGFTAAAYASAATFAFSHYSTWVACGARKIAISIKDC